MALATDKENAYDRYVLGLPRPKITEVKPEQAAQPTTEAKPPEMVQPAAAEPERSLHSILRLSGAPASPTAPAEPPDTSTMTPEMQKTYTAMKAEEKADKERGEFTKGVYRGAHGLASSLYGAAALLGEVGGASGLKQLGVEGYQAHEKRAEKYAPAVRLTDIDSPGAALKWAAGTLGELVPSMTEAVITSTAGALAGTAVAGPAGAAAGGLLGRTVLKKGITEMVEGMVKNGVGKEVAESAATRLAYRALGTKAGIVGGVAPLEIGGNYMEALDKGVDSPLTAIATGLAAGFLEIAGGNFRTIEKVLGAKGAKAFTQALERADTNVVARILKEAATQAPQEFAQEASQEALSMANMAMADPTFEAFTKENALRLLESGAAGAVGGVAFGAVGGVVPEKREAKHSPITDPAGLGKQLADEGKEQPAAPTITTPEAPGLPKTPEGAPPTLEGGTPTPAPTAPATPPIPIGAPDSLPDIKAEDEPEVPYFGAGNKVDADHMDFLNQNGLTWDEVKTWPIERREDLENEYTEWVGSGRGTEAEAGAVGAVPAEAEGVAGAEAGTGATVPGEPAMPGAELPGEPGEPGVVPADATEGPAVDEAGRPVVAEPGVPGKEVVVPEEPVTTPPIPAPKAGPSAEELRQQTVGEKGELQWEKNRDATQQLLGDMANRSANPKFVRDKVRDIIDGGGTVEDVKKLYSVKDATSGYANAYAKQYYGDRQRIIDMYHEANQSTDEEKALIPEAAKGQSNKDLAEAALTVSFVEDGKPVEGPMRAEFQRIYDDMVAEEEGKAHTVRTAVKEATKEAVQVAPAAPATETTPLGVPTPTTGGKENPFLRPTTDGKVTLGDAKGNVLATFDTAEAAAKEGEKLGYNVSDTHLPGTMRAKKEVPSGKKVQAEKETQAEKAGPARDRGAKGKEKVATRYTGDEEFLNTVDLDTIQVEVDAVGAETGEAYRVKQSAREALDNNDRYSECLYELRACLEA